MSKEEKLEMMDKMMEEFLSGFTGEEKMEMMMGMMPKMMSQMMGGGDIGMMEGMFGAGGEGESRMKEMMEFCGQMMEGHDVDFRTQMMNRCMEFMKSMMGRGGETGEDSSSE